MVRMDGKAAREGRVATVERSREFDAAKALPTMS